MEGDGWYGTWFSLFAQHILNWSSWLVLRVCRRPTLDGVLRLPEAISYIKPSSPLNNSDVSPDALNPALELLIRCYWPFCKAWRCEMARKANIWILYESRIDNKVKGEQWARRIASNARWRRWSSETERVRKPIVYWNTRSRTLETISRLLIAMLTSLYQTIDTTLEWYKYLLNGPNTFLIIWLQRILASARGLQNYYRKIRLSHFSRYP